MAARNIASHFKVSLHESGDWRVGFTKEHAESSHSIVPKGRHRQWMRYGPAEVAPGVIRAVTVLIPTSEVKLPAHGRKTVGDIYWHPTPGVGRGANFTVSMTSPATVVSSWPGRSSSQNPTEYVGSFSLSSGWTVWVTVHEQAINPVDALRWERLKKASVSEAGLADEPEGSLGEIAMGVRNDDGTAFFVDLQI